MPHQPAGSGRVLSPRELEVVRRAGAGLSNKQIGLELGITPETVETHLKRARSKLGAVSRRDAARIVAASVPNSGGPQPSGIAPASTPAATGPVASLPIGEDATGRSLHGLRRYLGRSITRHDSAGTLGRLLWVSGMAVLVGLLAIGLVVAADGFAVTVHNLAATGHSR